MNEFSINEAAASEIRRIFLQSNFPDPVARMYERANPGALFDALGAEVMRGVKTAEELSSMGRNRLAEVVDQLHSQVMVGADERAEFRPEDLREVDGITFVLGSEVAEMLRGYCLTFDGGRFLFRGLDNAAHTLRSIARKM